MIKMNQSLDIRSKGFIRIYIMLLLERGILSKLITIQTSFYEIQPGALLHPLMKYFPILKQIGNGPGNLLCQATRYTQHRVKPPFEVDGSLINCDLFIILQKIMQLSHSLLKNFLSKKRFYAYDNYPTKRLKLHIPYRRDQYPLLNSTRTFSNLVDFTK